jgi:hypothetical protein
MPRLREPKNPANKHLADMLLKSFAPIASLIACALAQQQNSENPLLLKPANVQAASQATGQTGPNQIQSKA